MTDKRNNIQDDELAAFKMLATQLLAYVGAAMAKALEGGVLMKVKSDDETIR